MWSLCGSVHYRSTNQANSAFHPFGVSKWVVIHVITWIIGWRPLLANLGCMWLSGHKVQSPMCAGLVYAHPLCDVQRHCSCRLCHYTNVTSYLFTYLLTINWALQNGVNSYTFINSSSCCKCVSVKHWMSVPRTVVFTHPYTHTHARTHAHAMCKVANSHRTIKITQSVFSCFICTQNFIVSIHQFTFCYSKCLINLLFFQFPIFYCFYFI